jgi:hypothetical protein
VHGERTRKDLLFGIAALALVAALATERAWTLSRAAPTDFDDAYMYLRYANNWLAGQGLAWNRGEGSVFGTTSLLHVAVVAAVRWTFPRLEPAGVLHVASGGAALGLLAALVGMLALCSRSGRLRRAWILSSALVLLLVGQRDAFVFHAGTGMDTMLSALANAGLAFGALQFAARPTVKRAAWTALISIIAVLARPDNLLCAFLCPVLAVLLLAPRPWGKPLAAFGALAVVLLATLVLADWRLLGTPLPLAFFAKRPWYYGGFAGEFTWNPYLFFRVFLSTAWPFVAGLILLADRAGWRRAAALLLPACASMAMLFSFNQIMGHLGRFYFPFLPFFVAAGGLEITSWLARVRAGLVIHPRAVLLRAGLAVVAVLVADFGLCAAAERYQARAQAQTLAATGGYHVPAASPLPELDSWQSAQAIAAIAAAAPDGTSFAMSEHGLPGALAPQVAIIDVLGLHDRFFAQHGFSAPELFRRKPDAIWMPHPDHTQMLRDILDSDELWSHYVFYPDAFAYGVALRTDGPHYAHLATLLKAQWQGAYSSLPMADYVAARGEWNPRIGSGQPPLQRHGGDGARRQ